MHKNIKEVNGNILDFPEGINVIIHGCNTLNIMGAGLAKLIREKYPEVYAADTQAFYNGKVRLGRFSGCKVDDGKYIINLYIQSEIGTSKRMVDYEALYSGLQAMKTVMLMRDGKKFTVGFPRIGCGLAGGDWHVVKSMIESVFGGSENIQVVLVNYGTGAVS
jgi:O-acetyl-ADP-ribose deacetylase (regulator of RNase III)